MIVSFGEAETTPTIKFHFMVVDCPSIYQFIFGRPTLAKLIAIPSTVNLKMKYYTIKRGVATL